MKSYVVLLRGINVGGKNKISMVVLKLHLEKMGFTRVMTYIASGNVILESDKSGKEIKSQIEDALSKNFNLDSQLIKVLVLSQSQLEEVINNKPSGFGEQPNKYHSDVIFLIDVDSTQAMSIFNPREGVDKVWLGNSVIYSQRLSTLRTKSSLSNIIGTSVYKSMTIRTWNTTIKLLSLVRAHMDKSN